MLAGRYEITRQLGGGGFAITFLARDHLQPSKPLCVVKQLRPNHTHPRVVEFFEKEAAILERLGKHPQIPQLLAHFSENQNLYIVQEFIEGQDLSKEIVPGKQLSEGYVSKLLQEVLEILCFVHDHGVIHRDIKPQNLMRRHQDGKIFLIDFGAVKELVSLMVNTQGELISSIVIGTPGYMPNEQKNGKPCLASDLFALGMTAIQALTGILPTDIPEYPLTGELIWRHQAQVSDRLADVLTKMVRRHYTLRYLSTAEALQALTPPPPPPPPPQPSPQPSLQQPTNLSRRRLIQTISLFGAGIVVTVVGENIFQPDSTKKTVSPTSSPISSGATPISPLTTTNTGKLALKTKTFDVVTVDEQGNITNRSPSQANFFTQSLGNGITLEMVEIPGGKFLMGSPPGEKDRGSFEGPQHTVTIQSFFMAKYTVTQQQYQALMGNNPSAFKGSKRPVEQVSWDNATEFCAKLSQRTGKTYRLPSEAEWEYACRAGTTTPFNFGATITAELVNYNGNSPYASAPKGKSRQQTTDVGIFPPNAFFLYDMHGNVWEWCQDTWHNNYNGAPVHGKAWLNDNDNQRLLRGGSWNVDARYCRSAYRFGFPRVNWLVNVGFRVVVGAFRY